MNRTALVCTTIASLALVGAALVIGGPLDPPAGPVAPTYKTLGEVEPRVAINGANTPGDADSQFKITQSGSYYLTGNIVGLASKHGIEVAADNVTIDLNGFAMLGIVSARDAVRSDGGPLLAGLTVRNGSMNGWGSGGGVFAGNIAGVAIESVRIFGCAFDGIWVGARARVSDCTVSNCRYGIRVGNSSLVERCSIVTMSQVGIEAGEKCMIDSCTTTATASDGILINLHGVVRSCTVTGSTAGNGINASAGYCLIQDCTANNNNRSGIRAITHCEVVASMAHQNAQNGLHITTAGVVRDSFFDLNAVCGILMDSGGAVDMLNNQCSQNGNATSGAGIRINNNGSCRVESNVLALNFRGLDITSGGNAIIRNHFRANSSANSIAPANVVGPTVDSANVATSSNPHANYNY